MMTNAWLSNDWLNHHYECDGQSTLNHNLTSFNNYGKQLINCTNTYQNHLVQLKKVQKFNLMIKCKDAYCKITDQVDLAGAQIT